MRKHLTASFMGIALAGASTLTAQPSDIRADPVKIGILHSKTGTMADSETPLIDAAKLAIAEINRNGGVLGQRLEYQVEDGRSDTKAYIEQSRKLIEKDHVSSVFGCWTSVCRKAVIPVVEEDRNLLWYPVQYEGRESSRNVIYTGAAPNQQIIPALRFGLDKLGHRVLLVGTDSVFPRTANAVIKDYLRSNGLGPPVGEIYRPWGDWDFSDVGVAISRSKPDWIFNTVNGDSNVALFKALGMASAKPRVMSVSIAEVEIPRIGIGRTVGHYAAWNYFQSLPTRENQDFVSAFKSFTTIERVTDDPLEAAYFQVHLFAKAIKKAKSRDPMRIREAALGLEMHTPGGWIRIDPDNQHTWKTARIGEINENGQFDERWSSVDPIAPEPYPRLTHLAETAETPQEGQISDDALIALLTSDLAHRRYAARQMGELTTKSAKVVAALGRALRDPDWLVRRNAADSLVQSGSDGAPALINALGDQNERLRATAAYALAALGTKAEAGTAALIDSFSNGDLETREESVQALAKIGPAAAAAIPALVKATEDTEASVRFLSLDALGAIGFRARDALPRLYVMIGQSGLGVRARAAEAVAQIAEDMRKKRDTLGLNQLEKVRARLETPLGFEVREQTKRTIRESVEMLQVINEARWGERLFRTIRENRWFACAVTFGGAYLLALLVFWIIGLRAFPGWILRASNLLEDWRIPVNNFTLTLHLDKLFAVGWFRHNPRVLDAWVSEHADRVRLRFNNDKITVRQRTVYIPMPVDIGENLADANVETFRHVLDADRWCLLIRGEGGSGKTALACQIGRWAMGEDAGARLNEKHLMLPILIEPGTAAIRDLPSLIEIARGQLEDLIGSTELNAALFNALLRRQRVIVIVDDIRELAGAEGSDWILPGSPDFPIAALVVTSRTDETLGGVSKYTVQPKRIGDASTLTSFMSAYLKHRGCFDRFNPVEISNACIRLLTLDRGREETDRAITVMLAKMYAEQMIGTKQDKAPTALPKTIPEVMLGYINEINRRHKDDLYDDRAVQGAAMAVAWACLEDHLRPVLISRERAIGVVNATRSEQMIRYLESKVGLVQVVGPRKDRIRFTLDPLAEYLAGLFLVDSFGNDEVKWHSFLLKASAMTHERSLGAPVRSFMLALRVCCLDPENFRRTPAFLPQRLGEIAGLDPDTNRPFPIRVGILHSLTGPMAISERPLIDAAMLAIQEINVAGGILGRPIEAVIEDGESDENVFRQKASKLVDERGVCTVFGCWTSASRKAVLPVFEERNHLLWYPVQYEGYESSPNVVYTGSAPNQQIIPAVEYCLLQLGRKRFFLVGSDSLFPRHANRIIKSFLGRTEAVCVGEAYQPLSNAQFAGVISMIKQATPDIIINTFNGQGNNALFQALREAGIGPQEVPVMSVSIAEVELDVIGWELTGGHYCAWSYFEEVATPSNVKFVRDYRKAFGQGRMTDDPIEAAYSQVHLFALAVAKAESTEPRDVRAAVRGLEFEAPGGTIRIDEENQHSWKVARIGRIRSGGGIEIVWTSEEPIRPDPFLKDDFPDGLVPLSVSPSVAA